MPIILQSVAVCIKKLHIMKYNSISIPMVKAGRIFVYRVKYLSYE